MIRKEKVNWQKQIIFPLIFAVMFLTFTFSGMEAHCEELVIASWGGHYNKAERKAFFDSFEKETGVKILDLTAVGADAWAKARAQVESGNVEWDIISTRTATKIVQNYDILEKIDYSIVTNTDKLMESAKADYWVGGVVSSTNIGFNLDKFPGGNHPKSWADFWDVKKFPGPRSLPNWGGPEEVIAVALIADGVPSDKLIPFDYERAFSKLDQIKPHVEVWWSSGAQFQQILRDEEVVTAMGWNGRITALQKQGLPIGIEWNQGLMYPSCWVVLKGSKKRDLAMKFLDYTLDPKRQAIIADELGYGGTNVEAAKYTDPKTITPTSEGIFEKQFSLDPEWLAKNQKDIIEKWETWLAK